MRWRKGFRNCLSGASFFAPEVLRTQFFVFLSEPDGNGSRTHSIFHDRFLGIRASRDVIIAAGNRGEINDHVASMQRFANERRGMWLTCGRARQHWCGTRRAGETHQPYVCQTWIALQQIKLWTCFPNSYQLWRFLSYQKYTHLLCTIN